MQATQFFQGVNAKMRSWGYNVIEQEGCWSRSNGSSWAEGGPIAHTNHHFVIRLSSPIADGVRNVTYGDSTLSGPKCNYYIGQDPSTGKPSITFIAAGTANHPGQGRSETFDRVSRDVAPLGWVAEKYSPVADNWSSATRYYCGTEMHHPGDDTPWPSVLIQLAVDLNAAMCMVGGWSANRCHMHAEHSARKIDMSYLRGRGGPDLRARIAARISGGTGPTMEDELSAAEVKQITDAVAALSKRMDTLATEVWTKGITGTQAGGRANEMLAAILGGVNADAADEKGQTSALSLLTKVSRPMVLVRDTESPAGATYSVGPDVVRRVTGPQLKAGVAANLWGEEVFPVKHADISALLAWSQAPNGLFDDGGAVPPPPPPPPSTTAAYTVVAGDTWSSIAAKFNITSDQLRTLNPSVNDINVINVGQVLRVPKA